MEQSALLIVVLPVTLMLGMLAFKVPVAVSLGLSGFVGFIFVTNPQTALARLGQVFYSSINYTFASMVLFILMGEIIIFTGIGSALYKEASNWTGGLPGSLSIATILASGLFGAICGSSIAGTVTIGLLSVPEMQKRNYSKSVIAGAVVAGGSLSALIPPSIGFVIYGLVAEQSIGKLFLGGIIPGIILTLMYAIFAFVSAVKRPESAPTSPPASRHERLHGLKTLVPVVTLFILVLGSMYTGVATATEAAAIGAIGALGFAAIYRKLSFENISAAAWRTARTVAFISVIFISALFFGYYMAYTGATAAMVKFLTSLDVSRWVIMTLIMLLLIILGCFLDAGSIILITTPLILPLIKALGFDPIWYGVALIVNMELGFITPPMGLNLFAFRGIAPEISMKEVIVGAFPYMLLDCALIALIVMFPQLALWLPNTMMALGK